MLTKQTFDNFLSKINTSEVMREAEENEIVKIVVNNFANDLNLLGVSSLHALQLSKNLGAHLALFDHVARLDEREKQKAEEEVKQILKPAMNLESFRRSISLLSDNYTRTREEKDLLKKIIERIKL